LRASELLLIVRAQNQASSALRRVAGDLRGLSAMQQLGRRGESLNVQRQQLMTQRQRIKNEMESITQGQRALALEKARSVQSITSQRNALRATGEGQRALRNQESMLANQRDLSRLQRQAARYAETGVGGRLLKENQLGMEKNAIAARRLVIEQSRIAGSARTAAAAIAMEEQSLAGLTARETAMGQRLGVLGSQLATVGDRLRLNAGDINENNKAIRKMRWEPIVRVGSAMQHGARIMEYAGLVLGASLGVMAHHAATFQQNVTLAATQTRSLGAPLTQTAQHAKVLEASILSLSKQFPQSVDDMSKAAYDLYSSTSVGFGRGQKLMKTFAQAAVAGQTDMQTATSAGITVLNNFQQSVDHMPQLMQKMFAAVRFGRMTFQDFATSMSTLGPAARASNQSFTEMAGTFAFLTRHLRVSYARVGYARVLEALASPKMLTGLAKVGIHIQNANHQLIPLHEIIGKIIQRFPKLTRGGTDAMNFFKNIGGDKGTIQARRALTFLLQFYNRAGKDGSSYLSMLKQVRQDHDEFTKSLGAMEKTTGVRWGVFVNQLKALALAFGAQVIPALLQLSGPIQNLIKWWGNLSDATKRTIAVFATFTAAGSLIGGALLYVVGTFTKLFGLMGRGAGFGAAFTTSIFAIVTAVTLLSGNLHGLADILDTITNFAFSSWQGAAITLSAAAVAATRLTGALRGLAAANAVEGGTAGGGGILGLFGRGRAGIKGLKELYQVKRLEGAGRTVAGLAATVATLPGGLLPVLGIVGAIGAGLALWKLHMREAASEARFLKENMDIGRAPGRQFDVFQQLPRGVEDARRAQIAVRMVRREIEQMQKQLKTAKGAERGDLLDRIQLATLDLHDANARLATSYSRVNTQFNAFNQGLSKFVGYRDRVRQLQKALADSLTIQARTPTTPGISSTIDTLRKNLIAMEGQARVTAVNLRSIFSGVVTQLAKMGQIKMPGAKVMSDLFNTAKRAGRMLTIPEMKAIIRAELDPRAARRIPGDIRKLFAGVKTQRIKVEAEQTAGKKAARTLSKTFSSIKFAMPALTGAEKAARSAHGKVASIFSKTIHQKVTVDQPKNLGAIGASISAGIQAGMTPITATVIEKVIKAPIEKSIRKGSPSRWAAEEVGKPIMQGIVKGLLDDVPKLEKAATAAITLFQSAAIQKAQEGKKKVTDAMLIGDVRGQTRLLTQFNNAIARLQRRHVPRAMVDALAALGPDAAKFISQISMMSDRELKKYVAAWIKANNQVKRSTRATAEDIKQHAKDMAAAMKDAIKQGVSNLQDMFQTNMDTNLQNFGGIFDGLDGMVGDGFKQAMDQYNSSMSDFRGQISDLNQQIADAQVEAQQRLIDAIKQRKDELQSVMGQLFSGDWLQGTEVQTKIDWGQKLGFADLQKDLESQVNKFARWRADLTSLAAKVPPDLAKELENLGPDAVDKLDILNNATGDQLAQYVATWQSGQNQIAAVANQTTVDTSDITARIGDIVKQIDDVTHQMAQLVMPHELTAQDIIDNIKKQQDQWVQYSGVLQSLIDKGLPADLVEQISSMGPQALPYMMALNSMTTDQLNTLKTTWEKNHDLIFKSSVEALNRQLQLWFNYGVNIARNIISGIRSQGDYLTDYFTELIKSLMTGTGPPPAPAPPPYTGASPPYPVTGGGATGGAASGGSTTGGRGDIVINQHITAVQDQTLSSIMNQAGFRLKTTLDAQ
jgi:TP901 family phage tail tape measure protein